jgi:hypothetical protein
VHAPLVVIGGKSIQLAMQVEAVPEEGLVEILAPKGSDQPLDERMRARDEGDRLEFLDVEDAQIRPPAMKPEQWVMIELGYRNGWGFGRHVLGSNYFHYVRDPWNSYAEYSFGIDYVPIGTTWPAGDHPPDDAFYVWGPDSPANFGTNYE